MATDKVLECSRHLGFMVHRIHHSFGAVFAHIELGHSTTAMAKDAIVESRGITEKGVGCNILTPAMDVAGRKARPKMLAKWETGGCPSKLGGGLDGLLDVISRDPTKVRV